MADLWLVIGAGVSGLGAARFLRSRGDQVRVSERSVLPPAKAQAFRDLGVQLQDGGHDPAHLNGVTGVIASPGLPANHPLLAGARERRLPVLSEIDLALAAYRGQVIAVTGTNGKSTTCAMTGHVLTGLGLNAGVGGNFGDPPTAMLADGRAPDYLVLELSSYQLEGSEHVAPAVAVFTSFSHDHIARHGSLDGYLRAKWRIFDRQAPGSLAVVPDYVLARARQVGLGFPPDVTVWSITKDGGGDPHVLGFGVDGGGLVLRDGKGTLTKVPLTVHGVAEPQNQLNAGFALAAAAHLTGRSIPELAPRIAGFRGLPHRCELVGWRGAEPVINDSKSTNVESTLVALASLRAPALLMMGGQGKGEPYAPILAEKARIAAVITFGATGPEIAKALRGDLTVHEFPTLKAALAAIGGILERHPHGVLFSPGCASFDEFNNYEERGDVFRKAMESYCRRPG